MPTLHRPHARGWLLVACATLAACASAPPPPPSSPAGSEAEAQAEPYPGRCALLAIEQDTREADLPSDSVQLVARYRPQASGRSLGLSFRVQREREHDLRAHLEQHADVLCHPESGQDDSDGGDDASAYRVEVPPFEGQAGQQVVGPTR